MTSAKVKWPEDDATRHNVIAQLAVGAAILMADRRVDKGQAFLTVLKCYAELTEVAGKKLTDPLEIRGALWDFDLPPEPEPKEERPIDTFYSQLNA